ncbi:MAG: hypothetical protein GKS03_04870 [Alphaproteobacteria bacterium]|nr:hypothetical protein [Alphaproteobacteria bacterium]
MTKNEKNRADLNDGLDHVKDLPGFDKGHPHYFNDQMIDHLLEICLQLAGEIWVNRDRQAVMEHLLATKGKVTPEMIEEFKPDAEMKQELKDARKVFSQRIFGSLYADLEDGGKAEFMSGVVKGES